MKIIALLPVKNEEWCLEHCLTSLSFADSIITIDDNSTDSTLEILKKYNCTIIPFETSTNVGWKEYEIRTRLLQAAREQGATHIIALDADEACSEEFQKNAREILQSLKPGQSLELEWLNLCSKTTFKKPQIFKTFAFCDDGVSVFAPGFIGIPRVPTTGIEAKRIEGNNLIFHYQFIDQKRCQYKQVWYMISEFLKKEKSAKRINNMYGHTKEFTCREINNSEKQPKTMPLIQQDNIWQRDEIVSKLKEHGALYFEPLDIWHLSELEELFIQETGRKPEPKKFPKWLVTLNTIKNQIKKIK